MNTKEDFFLTEEAAEWIGLKKSEYLSDLVTQINHDDFGFEEFHLYDRLIPQTISEPDRAFDDKSDIFVVRVCIRTYPEEKSFHHLVVGAIIPDHGSKTEVFVPILSFVTRKVEVVQEWSKGESLPRPTLN